ncbi:BMP family lipoprotein [Mycetocola saprophilus]|uniref:BMP family lipoprotein n=1 Tax=Mycetocola saprophilus TaxID=76636 RepID=UPI0004BEA5AD|nr:BMP family ABC transporter substrate-binding protein [Mycetocola saprophilus]
MTISVRKAAAAGIAGLGVIALLAGCGQAPTKPAEGGAADSKFLPCIVSDSGGFDDKSFNQSSYEGLVEAAKKLGVKPKEVQSDKDDDYAPNMTSLVDQNCSIIFSVGFKLSDATKVAATANPKIHFVTLDDNQVDLPNVKHMIYDTAEASFLAGYTAASYSKTGVVGTFGGMQLPTVTIFMDGFADGVKYFNEQKGKDVQVRGWNVDTQNGSFTGDFAANDTAKQVAAGLIEQNVDVIMPVGGPVFQSAITAIKDSKKDVAMIGVDADLYETAPADKDLYLTSVLKQMKSGTNDIVTQAGKGKFDATAYIGTLENNGVGLAPFHDFESKVDPKLQDELDTIKKGIIDGSIVVKSPSSPKK